MTAVGSAHIYLTKWRKKLRHLLKATGVLRVEDLGMVDYVIVSPGRVKEASIAEKKKRGSKNGVRNPKGNGEKGDRLPPAKGGHMPAMGGSQRYSSTRGIQPSQNDEWPKDASENASWER
jgi:hypothetical protein